MTWHGISKRASFCVLTEMRRTMVEVLDAARADPYTPVSHEQLLGRAWATLEGKLRGVAGLSYDERSATHRMAFDFLQERRRQ